MKNTSHTQFLSKRQQAENRETRKGQSFPQITNHFQASSLTGNCGQPAHFAHPPFSDISKDYFTNEEPRGFAVEAAIFTALSATALLPIVNSLQAVTTLIQHLGVL